jgi:hypothetical protein
MNRLVCFAMGLGPLPPGKDPGNDDLITSFPEVYMQCSPTIASPPPVPQMEHRPFLVSFDSAREFSVEHLVEVSWLVEHQDDELEGYVFEDCLVSR